MLKRFTALLFVLTVAGNVWAGLCGCMDGSDHPRSSCCDRPSAERDSVAAKPCCDEDCGETTLSITHRVQADGSLKLPLPKYFGETAVWASFSILEFQTKIAAFDKKLHIWHAEIPRPPNLYIHHSSFLI